MAHVMFRQRSSRGGRSLRKRHDSEEETVHLDLTKGVGDNLREILVYLVRQEGVSKNRKLAYLNSLVKLSPKITDETELGFSLEEVFCCLRVLLVHDASEVRAGCLRALRHLVRDASAARALVRSHVPVLVARALDAALESRTERLQALRLVRRLVTLAPDDLPPQLARCLVAVAADGAKERDDLVRACLGTLCELALLNPKLCVETGGFRTLLHSVLDCPQPHIAEAMLGVLFHSINDPATRHLLRLDIDLEYLVAPFTDSHFRYADDLPENSLSDDRELRFQTSRIAMTSVLRSWPGMVYFCKPPPSGSQSLVEVLCLPLPDARKNILALFYDIFCLALPAWTSDFEAALASSDRAAMQESWKLYEGFVAAEGRDLLPPVTKHRSNLVANYLALLLLAFVQAGILEALVEVIVTSEDAMAIQATILLAELLYMASMFLPSEASRHCHCLPTLMSQAASFDSCQKKRIRASTAVARLSRIHALKRRGMVPCSLFLDQLLQFCSHTKRSGELFCDVAGRSKLISCLHKDSDEAVLHTIKDTLVLSKEYTSWDWDLISSVLKWPGESLKSLGDATLRNFVKRLLLFFKPSSKQFSLIEAKREGSRQIVIVGCQFFEFLLEADESKANDYIEDFLIDLCNCLHEVEGEVVVLAAVLSPTRVASTVAHGYFLFLGRLSSSSKGTRCLEKLGVYQHLVSLVSMSSQDIYMKLVVSCLDYTKPGFARTLLTKVLTATSETARLYATNYLRVLLRLELLDFRKWAMELLVTQLYDKSRAVSLAASDILDEACDLRENLEALIALRPALLCLGDRGLLLQIRFLSLPSGFKYLLEANVLESELSKWDEVNHLRYVKIVEDVINQAVTWHQRGEDGTYGRRSSNTRLKVQDVFAPVHLYGQLVQHLQGLSYLQQHGSLRQHWETVLLGDMTSLESLLRLKASLWTVGHVGTSPEGFALVSEADVLPAIVKMAQDAPVYSIRGTCFYVLCLLATTAEAVEALASLGWESVQHRHHEAWPIAADALAGLAVPSPTNSPRGRPHAWSVSSTGSQWSELLSASALHRRFRGTSTASSFEGVESPLADTPSRRTLNFVTQQSRAVGAGPNIRQAQTLPRNATLSPRVDAVVASSRRPRSSSDCRPGEPTTHDSAAPAPTERSRLLAIPCTAKDRSGSFGGSRDSGTESTSLGEKSASALEVCSAAVLSDAKGAASATTGPKGERSDSNESSQTTGTGKSRSDSCTDSTTSGVSSCDEVGPRAVQTLSPIASSTSLSTLGGHRSESAPRRPRGFPGGSGSLSRGSMSASPTSPDLPVTMYTSARDAAGYATLRALREASSLRRRRRVCSLGCDGAEEDALLATLAGRSLERSGFYIGEEPSPEDRAGSRTASVASDISHLTARPEMRDAEEKFMGLCLPVDTSLIFTVREEEGLCEECERPPTIPEVAEDRNDGFELHTVENCLQCHSVARVAELRLSRTNGDGHPGVTKVEGFQYLGSTADQKTDANYVTYSSQSRKNRRPSENDYDVVAVRKELLRYIANLNSSVILKGSEQGLLSLKQKYPKAFQDVCLYSEVCLLMARYRFRLSARTFLQELFLDIGFEKQFLEEAEDILRIPHIVIMPPAEESEA
ncbi:rapamycin-insensitive companion of mTOR isoform X2 [Ixodes scapularis]